MDSDFTLNVGFENSEKFWCLDVKQSYTPTEVLSALIKETKFQHHVNILKLRIFKPKDLEALAVVPQKTLAERMNALGDLKDWCTQWEPIERAGQIFSQEIEDKYVNIIIRGWPSSDSLSPDFDPRSLFFKHNPPEAPSSGGKPSEFKSRQTNNETAVLCGRPASNNLSDVAPNHTVPPTLFHPVFAQFVEDCATYKPTVDEHDFLTDLAHEMTVIFQSERDRMSRFRQVMCRHGLEFTMSTVNGKYKTNGDVHIAVDGLDVYPAFVEGKNEVSSTGGAEPFFQSILYWVEAVRKIERTDIQKFKRTNHPCLLILHFGPYIGVAGAVWSNRPSAQMLTSVFPLNIHPTDTPMRLVGARLLGAIKKAIQSLKNYYRTEAFSEEPHRTRLLRQARFPYQTVFPYPSSYTDLETSRQIKFIYEWQLHKDSLVFFARTSEDEYICVKFVRRYSSDAHRALADLGCAPKLRGFEYLPGGWYLVVMDDLKDKYHEFCDADCTDALKSAVRSKVKAFHEKGYVHGDIRDVNLLVGNKDPTSFVFLDFDWAGEKGKVKYPMNVNRGPDLWRPEGAIDEEPIEEVHDIAMLEHLFEVS